MAGIQATARTLAAAGVQAAGAGPVSGVALADPPRSAVFQRISVSACAVLFTLVLAAAVSAMNGKPPFVMAETAALLAVGLGGLSWHILISRSKRQRDRRRTRTMTIIRLTVAGLAGIALIGPLNGAGYLIAIIALGGLGMDLPITLAAAVGIFLFAGANLAALVITPLPPVSTVVGDDVSAAFLFAVCAFVRSLRISQARARAEQALAEELLTQLRAAQATEAKNAILTERTHLAREVHDILAHSLTGLVLALDTAELIGRQNSSGRGAQEGGKQEDSQARILEQVARAQRIARDGLADTRRAISALRGDELPGPALLDQLVRDTSETAGIDAALTVTGPERPLSPEAGLAVYRTAQEALINSAKYAGRGGRAELRLAYAADSVKLEIEDVRSPSRRPPRPSRSPRSPEAQPLEPRSPEPRSPEPRSPEPEEPPRPGNLTFGGYGLTGIRERAELLGGELTAGPTTDGFRVSLRLPACEKDAIPQGAGTV